MMAQLCQDTSPLSTSALARAAATEAADTRARRQSVSAAFQTPAVCTPCDDSATRSEEIHHRTQDATDDGDKESDDRVSMLEKQVGDMTDLIKKMLLQNQQQAADARARENALTAQLAAASATKLSQSKSLPASNMLFNPYQEYNVRFSSAESTSCVWSGKRGGMDWRTARSTLFKTIATQSLRMASIAKGEYTADDAAKMGSATEHMYEIDNTQLANLVFRTIKTDSKDGINCHLRT